MVNSHKFFLLLKICNFRNFYRTIQIMNTEEDNNRQGKLNTPTQEAELVVELNYDIMKTIQILQEDLKSFRDDNLNEKKEQQVSNEALL